MNRYITPIFFAVLSVGVYIMYIDPTYAYIQHRQNKQKEYADYLEQTKTAQSRIANLKQIQQSFPSGYDQALATILPETIDPQRLIIDVEGLAQMRGLHLKSPGVTSPSVNGGISSRTLSFSVTAPYSVFKVFLRDLESSLALRDSSSISFSSASKEGEVGIRKNPELFAHEYVVAITTYSIH